MAETKARFQSNIRQPLVLVFVAEPQGTVQSRSTSNADDRHAARSAGPISRPTSQISLNWPNADLVGPAIAPAETKQRYCQACANTTCHPRRQGQVTKSNPAERDHARLPALQPSGNYGGRHNDSPWRHDHDVEPEASDVVRGIPPQHRHPIDLIRAAAHQLEARSNSALANVEQMGQDRE